MYLGQAATEAAGDAAAAAARRGRARGRRAEARARARLRALLAARPRLPRRRARAPRARRAIWESCWDHFGVILGSFWGHL